MTLLKPLVAEQFLFCLAVDLLTKRLDRIEVSLVWCRLFKLTSVVLVVC